MLQCLQAMRILERVECMHGADALTNPFVFNSLNAAIRDRSVYERARSIHHKMLLDGKHDGPTDRISDEEIRLAVKELYEEYEGVRNARSKTT